MADDVIPDEIKQFILNNIDSIAQLEALLLLHKDPQLDWTIDTVAKGLYISEQETSILLRRLCAGGFLITTAEKPLRIGITPIPMNLGKWWIGWPSSIPNISSP